MVDEVEQNHPPKRPRLVGNFIRQKREALNLSQRALGQLFEPPVTTQFISNVERGITPLPPTHVTTLAKALRVPPQELLQVLEQEYAVKLTGKAGDVDLARTMLAVSHADFAFIKAMYDAYQNADAEQRRAFQSICRDQLKVRFNDPGDSTPRTPV